MTAIERLLARLDGVRASGVARWMARCPAHDDKCASLSVRDAKGQILIHCFAGCSSGDVMAASGLRLSDLYDAPLSQHRPPIHDAGRQRIDAAALLARIQHESLVVVIVAEKLARGELFTTDEHMRLIRAANLIGNAVQQSVQPEPIELRALRRGAVRVRQ